MPTRKPRISHRPSASVYRPASSRKKVTLGLMMKTLFPSSKTKVSHVSRNVSRKSVVSETKLWMHTIIGSVAVAVLIVLGSVSPTNFGTLLSSAFGVNVDNTRPVSIGLEQEEGSQVNILFARKNTAGYVMIENQADTPLKISLPKDWARKEVHGTQIELVTSESPEFGFIRWTLPGKSGISLTVPTVPEVLSIESPSDTTSSVEWKSVNVLTGEKNEDLILVNKNNTIKLWEE